MININENETAAINKFMQNFANSAAGTLCSNLDNELYKKMELTIKSSESAEDLKPLKEGNIIYKSDYATGKYESSLALILPEELVALITDVASGGQGDKKYAGSLSETEISTTLGLFEKMFKSIEEFFKNNYSNTLAFSTTPKMLLKDTPEFEKEFEKSDFDFIVNQTLKIDEKRSFPVIVLLKFYDVKKR